MKKIFPLALAAILIIAGSTGCTKIPQETILANPLPPESPLPTEPSLPPESFLDSDGDGFNNWFEANIAKTDPLTANDRYFIFFWRGDNIQWIGPDGPTDASEPIRRNVDLPIQFLIGQGKVPPENIIRITEEEATVSALENAIERVAEMSDENDFVYIDIATHGSYAEPTREVGFMAEKPVKYATFNEWVDQIKARVVILNLGSCGCENAVPILRQGSYPRIIYLYLGGTGTISVLGANHFFGNGAERADTQYGNNNNYVSLEEVGILWNDNFSFQPNWPVLRQTSQGLQPSIMVDPQNIAPQTYLTDYPVKSRS